MKEDALSFLELLLYIVGIDPYGISHSEGVRELAVNLARRAGIRDDLQEMMDIELAARLHDIGKSIIPEYIRRMPGRYTMLERVIMEKHSVIGYELLMKIPNGELSENMKMIVKHHHEDWSGQGYPDGLRGKQIPFGARVLRIPDTYDALTHERGYQPAFSRQAAMDIMKEQQIKQTWADPDLLRLFLKMMK